jgi:hypothetical protein
VLQDRSGCSPGRQLRIKEGKMNMKLKRNLLSEVFLLLFLALGKLAVVMFAGILGVFPTGFVISLLVDFLFIPTSDAP